MKQSLRAEARIARAGFFPRGGGEALLEVEPAARLLPIDLSARGPLRRLTAIITTGGLPAHVNERGAAAVARTVGRLGLGKTLEIEERALPSHGPGAAVLLAAACDGGHAGFLALGARGLPMEEVAERAAGDFAAWWRTTAACDAHLADQLVLPLALAGGESRWSTPAITGHLRTVIWLVEQFLPVRFSLTAQPGGAHLVEVRPCEQGGKTNE